MNVNVELVWVETGVRSPPIENDIILLAAINPEVNALLIVIRLTPLEVVTVHDIPEFKLVIALQLFYTFVFELIVTSEGSYS